MNSTPHPPHASDRQSVVANFSAMLQDTLAVMIRDLGLCMSVSDLAFCQSYYTNGEKRFPTVEEIRMLDAIVRIRQAHADSYRLTRVNQTEGPLYATYADLLQKHYADGAAHVMPITLDEASRVGTRYLARIGAGRRPADSASTSEQPRMLPPESAILLLLPLTRETNVAEATPRFLADPEASFAVHGTLPVGEYGILMTLAEHTNGVFADLRRLVGPTAPVPMLSTLVTAVHGATLLISTRDDAARLSARAAAYGLRAVYFAKATATGRFILSGQDNPYLNMDLGFLRALQKGTEDADVYLPPIHPLFTAAMDDALLCSLWGAAQGNTRDEMALSMDYAVSNRATSPEALGCALATVLGIYRVQMELCISARSRIRYVDTVSAPTATVSLCDPVHRLPDVAAAAQNVYWLSLAHAPGALPDFAAVRTLMENLFRLGREGKLSAVRAVKGSLATALSAMGIPTPADLPTDAPHFGLLLCSAEALPYPTIPTAEKQAEPTADHTKNTESQEENP